MLDVSRLSFSWLHKNSPAGNSYRPIMRFTIFLSLCLFPAILSEFITTAYKHVQQDQICGQSQLSGMQGVITSPNYPSVYPNHTSCTWVITSPANSQLTITVTDLDIEEDVNCKHPPCCQHTWLSLPKGAGRRGSQQYCGSKKLATSVAVIQNVTFIKFHTSKVIKGGRGFQLKYTITGVPPKATEGVACALGDEECSNGLKCISVDGVYLCESGHMAAQGCAAHNMVTCGTPDGTCFDNVTQRCDGIKDCVTGVDETNCGSHNCFADELMCRSGNGCYKIHQKCDMKMDCSDFSDEINCGLCADGLVLCSAVDRRCFSPNLERCNGKFDCLFGEDEVGCVKGCPEDEIACLNGEGCYSPLQRCDSIRNCRDDSDETNCPSCSAIINKFPCDNGRCISGQLWCNGADDCGDGSDEQSCLKTSIITVAIMGSLICGLLLIVAMGCVCRLYGIRLAAGDSHVVHTAHHVMLQPDDGFFHREPPPAYTVTPNDCQPLQRMCAASDGGTLSFPSDSARQHNRSRSSRRHLGRRRSQRTLARVSSPPNTGRAEAVDFRSANLATAHRPPPNAVRETSLEAQQEPPIECKSPTISEQVDLSGICTAAAEELQRVDGSTSPLSTSTTSSLESPSRESGTSSTSLMSYQSGNDDTELLIL